MRSHNIEYLKKQAKNLYSDYKTRTLSKEGDIYEYSPKYYDITQISLDFDIFDDTPDFEFLLMKAQHLLAIILDFKSWKDLTNATPTQMEIAKIKLWFFRVDNPDNSKLMEYKFFEEMNKGNLDDDARLAFAKAIMKDEIAEGIEFPDDDEEEQYEEIIQESIHDEPPAMLWCLHCDKEFMSNETKLIKPKDSCDAHIQEVCKHWPECDGAIYDLMPVDKM